MNETPTISERERAYQAAIAAADERSAALSGRSLFAEWARLPREARDRVIGTLTPGELAALEHAWGAWARPKQRPPAELTDGKRILLWMMGRGGGKTKSATERVRERIEAGARSIALIGPTDDDVEHFMLGVDQDDEGLLNAFPPGRTPVYKAETGVVRFHTGATAHVYSAMNKELRGPNFDTVWGDEPAYWKHLDALWRNVELSTRKPGVVPVEIILTSTPKPLQFFKDLVTDPECLTITGSSAENLHNDAQWLARQQRQLAGTRLGLQELEGRIVEDDESAVFKMSIIEATRVDVAPARLRVAIIIDPSISDERKREETGIIALGIDDEHGELYVLDDASGHHTAEEWSDKAVSLADYWDAVAIVGERVRGGSLVEATVRAAMFRKRGGVAAKALNFVGVYDNKDGKLERARAVGVLHEKRAIHFVGRFPKLEEEITTWTPTANMSSPGRLDALVWGVRWLGNLDGDQDERIDRRLGMRGLGAITAAAEKAAAQIPPRAIVPPRPVLGPSSRGMITIGGGRVPFPKRTI